LGNKWFSIENTAELVKWSLQNTKNLVIVYVADSIHAINLEVRKRITRERADILADKMGTKFLDEIKKYLYDNLSETDFSKVRFVKWRELVDEEYRKKVNYLYQKYDQDLEFKESVVGIVKDFTSKESRVFLENEIHKLGMYILEELPECVARVQIGGYEVDAWTYPYIDNVLADFIYEIIDRKIFTEITDVLLDTKPKVLLEVRQDNNLNINLAKEKENSEKVEIGEVVGKGKGLLAKKDFKVGEVVFEIFGDTINYATDYTIPINEFEKVEPRLSKSVAQYMNHSCEPNIYPSKDGRKYLAMAEIKKGDEVVTNYGFLGLRFGEEKSIDGSEMKVFDLTCHCGTKSCKGKLRGYLEFTDDEKTKYSAYILPFLLNY
jgi:tRNA-dependent cyclodipeptide synthase